MSSGSCEAGPGSDTRGSDPTREPRKVPLRRETDRRLGGGSPTKSATGAGTDIRASRLYSLSRRPLIGAPPASLSIVALVALDIPAWRSV